MDWNALKSFMAIVETGSLSGAAKSLGVNHSTMFRRLQAFEQELGGRLFDRLENRYVLTPMGEEVMHYGKNISTAFDDIERRIVGKDFQPKGSVKITAPFNIANRYLPLALASFRESFPDISLQILASNQEVNMNSRAADIALRATPHPPEHLVGRQVAEISWSVYASEGYLQQYSSPQNLEQLEGHVLIGGTGQMLNLPTFLWLEKHFAKNIHTRCDELTAMGSFAMQGHGLAFLPGDHRTEALHCLGKFAPGRKSKLWVLTHPDLRKTERVRLVMQCLADYFSKVDFD